MVGPQIDAKGLTYERAACVGDTIANIPVGATVNWQWDACAGDGYGGYGTCVTHNITFDDGSGIQSGTQSTGSFSRTFNTGGTYKYHCAIHGAGMSGEIRVK